MDAINVWNLDVWNLNFLVFGFQTRNLKSELKGFGHFTKVSELWSVWKLNSYWVSEIHTSMDLRWLLYIVKQIDGVYCSLKSLLKFQIFWCCWVKVDNERVKIVSSRKVESIQVNQFSICSVVNFAWKETGRFY